MTPNNQTVLIIGGSSGLGLELGLLLSSSNHVIVTGRQDPKNKQVEFRSLDLSSKEEVTKNIDEFINKIPQVDLFIYAAGFYQEGKISDLSDKNIREMINVGLVAPAILIQRILKKQKTLPGIMAITSTSQWTPRRLEPIYTAVKAGLGMLANSLSLDENIGKVLVIGPAGMNTSFWRKSPRDMSVMLNPKWVAKQTIKLYTNDFEYKFAHILREPPRVEVIENR